MTIYIKHFTATVVIMIVEQEFFWVDLVFVLTPVGCSWDGGDCCGPNVDTSFCTDCECLDPAYSSTGNSVFSRHSLN